MFFIRVLYDNFYMIKINFMDLNSMSERENKK